MFRGRFEWLSAVPLILVTGALTILALSTLSGAQSPDVQNRERLFDFYQRLSPADYDPAKQFHLITIDRESVNAVGPWPWPRTILAELVESAGNAGATGVILTTPVDAPDPLSPETIGDFWLAGASDAPLAQQLALLPSTNQRLAEAYADVAGAVAVAETMTGNIVRINSFERADLDRSPWLQAPDTSANYLALPPARLLYDIDPMVQAAATPAIAIIHPDTDGLVRRASLLWTLNDGPAPALSLEAAKLAAQADNISLSLHATAASTNGRIVDSLRIGDKTTHLANGASMRLNFPKRLSIPTTSAAKLLDAQQSNSQLRDKVVLIGLDAELGDIIDTARGKLTPSAFHAMAATQLVTGESLSRPRWTGYLEALSVMIFGALAIIAAQKLAFWRAAGFAAIISLILAFGAFAGFAFQDLLISPLPAATALFIGALSVAGGKSIGGVLRDDNVRGSFHDTLPEPAMASLREDGASDVLEGVYTDMTVLACELRIIDEDLKQLESSPGDVTRMLAAAATELRNTILETGGAVDQSDGGRVFAYYGAPMPKADHVQTACAAALRLIESMDKINETLEASSRTDGIQMHLAIGIASGECFAGPMGHGRQNRYSAIGPAVDRAAFLRSQSEYYGPAMICDEGVYRHTHHHFAYLELDKLITKAAERPFSIFALIGNPFIKSSKGFRALDDSHRAFLKSYREGDIATARTLLDKTKQSPGAKIALFDIYEERVATLSKKGVPEDWDGVHGSTL